MRAHTHTHTYTELYLSTLLLINIWKNTKYIELILIKKYFKNLFTKSVMWCNQQNQNHVVLHDSAMINTSLKK